MDIYRILVPTDLSPCSERALSLAIALAKDKKDAEIILLHVIEPVVPGPDTELGILHPEALRTKMQQLAVLRQHEVQLVTRVIHGDPKETITATAKELGVQLIVMGTHGRTGLAHLLMGSTAEAVLRHADCPVITMRDRRDGTG